MRVLFLDTVSEKQAIHVALFYDGSIVAEKKEIAPPRQQAETLWRVLPSLLLTQVLKKIGRLEAVVVVVGPGSFSSVREGVVVANALALAWNIPVVGVLKDEVEALLRFGKIDQYAARAKKGEWVQPIYDKAPNISKAKTPWG